MTLRCKEPDRVPLGDWEVCQEVRNAFLGKKVDTLDKHVDFWYKAGFDHIAINSGILEPSSVPEGISITTQAYNSCYTDTTEEKGWAIGDKAVITTMEELLLLSQ